jgi:hypothetical protein
MRQKYCPYDGTPFQEDNYCETCKQKIIIQIKGPRKPRNFYEKMPEGMEDNYVDELFLKGMPHKNSFPNLHYPQMIKNTVEIVHVINSVFVQLVLFDMLMNADRDSSIEKALNAITVGLSVLGYILYSYFRIEENAQDSEDS